MKIFFIILLTFSEVVFSQQIFVTPAESKNYRDLTSYVELEEFLHRADTNSEKINAEKILELQSGRKIFLVRASSGSVKPALIIFAQQHGNEHGGKEAALLLIKQIASGDFEDALKEIDIYIIPQINPDGNEKNMRRNGNGKDLNRDHLIKMQPEVIALHKVIDRIKPFAALDVHEYYPYSESWKKFGYLKNDDVETGCLTNPNIANSIIDFSKSIVIPYIAEFMAERGYIFGEYCVGGPPDEKRMRFSTTDIDDGRQSSGMKNIFSFIQEGKNGRDSVDNLERRANSQMNGMAAFINFCAENSLKIQELLKNAAIKYQENDSAVIRAEHIYSGEPVKLNMLSLSSGRDTVLSVENFHSVIQPKLKVSSCFGYMISRTDTNLLNWASRNSLIIESIDNLPPDYLVQEYKMLRDSSVVIEEINVNNFKGEWIAAKRTDLLPNEYVVIREPEYLNPGFLEMAFEPCSQYSLLNYEDFLYLTTTEIYSIRKIVAAGK